jgi:hypothetical protein
MDAVSLPAKEHEHDRANTTLTEGTLRPPVAIAFADSKTALLASKLGRIGAIVLSWLHQLRRAALLYA